MTDTTPQPRLTFRQRWHRLRMSPRFPWLLCFGLLVMGFLSQVYCYWWSVRIEEMVKRNNGSWERDEIYPYWMRKHLGQKFVRQFEPIRKASLRMGPVDQSNHRSDDLRWLRGVPFLEELTFGVPLSPDDVWYLKWLRGLKTVRLYNTTEPSIDALEWLPSLSNLTVIFHEQVPTSTFRRIAHLPQLERLACYIHDEARQTSNIVLGYQELKAAAGLRRLKLRVANREQFLALTSPLPNRTPPFPELLELCISGTRGVRPEDLDQLVNLPNLIHLDLSYSDISDDYLPHLKRLPYLRTLYLEANPNITDEGAKVLASMTKLESLNIKSTRITINGQRQIAKLQRLRCLRVHLGSSDTIAFRKLIPPGCKLDTY